MRLTSIVGLSLLALACSPAAKGADAAAPATLSAEDIAAVQAVDAAFAAAMNARDTSAVVALYAGDARLLPPDSPALEGPAIRAFLAGMLAAGAGDFVLTPTATHGTGNLAYTVGTATFSIGGNSISSKYAEVLRKGTDGKWRYAVDMFNSATAPAPAPAPSK